MSVPDARGAARVYLDDCAQRPQYIKAGGALVVGDVGMFFLLSDGQDLRRELTPWKFGSGLGLNKNR